VSHCLGGNVYFIEEQCQAAGHSECVVRGKDAASWGPALEPLLPYFHAPDLQARMAALEERLARQRHAVERQREEMRRRTTPATSPGLDLPSAAFRRTLELADRLAKFDTTVLITGETGSGKEILARRLHERSPRAGQPLLALNCSALPEALLETELFGHRRGAFTGAARDHVGLFEEAHRGTVFLDEVGDISPGLQAKLLRVLQEKEIRRVGEPRPRAVDVRVISATNHDLEARVADGSFRRDLFYRLNVVRLHVPPLRERREDILPLARLFLRRCGDRHGTTGLRLAPDAVQALLDYPWPGNVRELENAIEHAAVMCAGSLVTLDCLPLQRPSQPSGMPLGSASQPLEEIESQHIHRVLESTGGNRAAAARILGIGEATLYRRLRRRR
jgi:transcriptional regulator with PAS, ATPase and Fis domain